MESFTFSDLKEGMSASFSKLINHGDVMKFRDLTLDENPLHLDKTYASSTNFKKPVVYGFLLGSYISRLVGMYLPGKYSLIISVNLDFKHPCFEGDVVTIRGEITKKMQFDKIIILETTINNQNNEIISTGKLMVKLLK